MRASAWSAPEVPARGRDGLPSPWAPEKASGAYFRRGRVLESIAGSRRAVWSEDV